MAIVYVCYNQSPCSLLFIIASTIDIQPSAAISNQSPGMSVSNTTAYTCMT